MLLKIPSESPPLTTDDTGTVRVGGSRLTLDTFLGYYNQGLSAADLTECFPALSLADVHGVIAYYLRHRQEVDEYLRARADDAERMRREFEAQHPQRGPSKSELLRRWEQKFGTPFPEKDDRGTPGE